MPKTPLLLALALFAFSQTEAQTEPPAPEKRTGKPELFQTVEKQPEFPGGSDAMFKFIAQNINYPPLARNNGISGSVIASFVVEKDGSISGIEVLRDIGGGCGDEVKRVISMMPKWKPGEYQGQIVKVRYTLPVRFNFNDGNEPTEKESKSASFPGGESALKQYIAEHTVYPKSKEDSGTQGEVGLQLKINKKGKVAAVKVTQSLGRAFDKAAVRMARKMPRWIPAPDEAVQWIPITVGFAPK